MPEPISHIARAVLPWRDASDNDTECGKPVTEFARVVTFEEASALWKKHGQQRAAFILCMTCVSTAQRWSPRHAAHLTFEGEPTERISREFGKRREQMDRELRAMAELVTRHRDEFDDLMAGRVVPIAELRRARESEVRQ